MIPDQMKGYVSGNEFQNISLTDARKLLAGLQSLGFPVEKILLLGGGQAVDPDQFPGIDPEWRLQYMLKLKGKDSPQDLMNAGLVAQRRSNRSNPLEWYKELWASAGIPGSVGDALIHSAAVRSAVEEAIFTAF